MLNNNCSRLQEREIKDSLMFIPRDSRLMNEENRWGFRVENPGHFLCVFIQDT
jgi:hypothetical protein